MVSCWKQANWLYNNNRKIDWEECINNNRISARLSNTRKFPAPLFSHGKRLYYFLFFLTKKEKKSQGKKNAPPFFRANAQRLR